MRFKMYLTRKNQILTLIIFILALILIYKNAHRVCICPMKNEYKYKYKYNIFFTETNNYRDYISLRQLCSIESAAKHNPDALVHILVRNARIISPIIQQTYPNIKWSIMNFKEIFSDTPLMEWWLSDKLTKKDNYTRFSHLSDALRHALVYKHGGFYSDLDFITIRNYDDMLPYSGFAATEAKQADKVGVSFFHMQQYHPFLLHAMQEYAKNYDPDSWGANGPLLVRRIIKPYCKITNNEVLLLSENDLPKPFLSNSTTNSSSIQNTTCDIVLFPYYYAYPFHMGLVNGLFEHNSKLDVSKLLHTYTIHFNSYLTKQHEITWNEYSIYEYLAAFNCPITHKLMKDDR